MSLLRHDGDVKIWKCNACGVVGPWTEAWGWFGSLAEADENVYTLKTYCSDACLKSKHPNAPKLDFDKPERRRAKSGPEKQIKRLARALGRAALDAAADELLAATVPDLEARWVAAIEADRAQGHGEEHMEALFTEVRAALTALVRSTP